MRNTSGGMTDLLAYFGLFMAAFGAATILPMQSEAVLAGLLLTGRYSAVWLVVTAGVGNILGSLVNWMLGRGIERFRQRRWFPVGEDTLDRAQAWYRKYGKWSLLASWVPVVGDPITVVAGVLREPLPTFLLLVTVAKLGRYVIVALATMNLA
ncbi:membrane protein YqaA with SNARE-associated domain [Rhizobium miluonense]|jgi:membrane protein YqaA with SNARE-associated domain|uniref:Membrane protein YqaA with SNARE-associated domain n=2 Tax=Rhizobium miluonense TaxID=411945 RepID=A0ABU1ST51_9HYPH|nr:membrane protein YqaA with SNARE-associated domain [Rhizobium miluonense]